MLKKQIQSNSFTKKSANCRKRDERLMYKFVRVKKELDQAKKRWKKRRSAGQYSEQVQIKSKELLNHVNKIIYNYLKKLEIVLIKQIYFVDVFDDTLEDLLPFEKSRLVNFECQVHRKEILRKAAYYYTTMGVNYI